MPKLSFACALHVGTESLHETVDIEVEGSSNILLSLKEDINQQLPSGVIVTHVSENLSGKKKRHLTESHFIVTLEGLELKEEFLDRFLISDSFPIVKAGKKGKREINARPLVKAIKLISPNSVELILKHIAGPELKPTEIVKRIFSLEGLQAGNIKILKTKQIVMAGC